MYAREVHAVECLWRKHEVRLVRCACVRHRREAGTVMIPFRFAQNGEPFAKLWREQRVAQRYPHGVSSSRDVVPYDADVGRMYAGAPERYRYRLWKLDQPRKERSVLRDVARCAAIHDTCE